MLPCLGSFSVVRHIKHIEGPASLASYSVDLHYSHLKGAPWVGSYSVVQCIRHLMGQPLYCSAVDAGVCGEQEAMVMAPSPMHDSAVSLCFHGCPAFLHSHFPPQPPPSHPLNPALHSQQRLLPWDCSTIPQLQLLATAPSGVYVAAQGLFDSHSI